MAYWSLTVDRFREEFLRKIDKRIAEYKIDMINNPRPGKHLLVLDVDYTLFGMKTDPEWGICANKPFQITSRQRKE